MEQTNELSISLNEIVDLAVEFWRFEKFLEKSVQNSPAVNHYLRQTRQFFSKNSIETIDLTNQNYEAGLAIEVIDFVENGGNQEFISEMTSPIVLFQGKVIRHGQAVVGK